MAALVIAVVLSVGSDTPRAQAAFGDSDLDGASDVEEVLAGSDPANALSKPETVGAAALTSQPACTDSKDNDLDGLTDSADPGCVDTDSDLSADFQETFLGSSPSSASSTPEHWAVDEALAFSGAIFGVPHVPKQTCSDGTDNDGDTLTDSADPDCPTDDPDGDGFDSATEKSFGSHPGDITKVPENQSVNATSCSDTLDNDGDTLTDAADLGCQSSSFIFPLACTPNVDCYYINYPDKDTTTLIKDYNCGLQSYDGHVGTDVSLKSFRQMDQGVAVKAAELGVVLIANDGNFDRNTTGLGTPKPGNDVVILHPSGLRTVYKHLRKGSVTVVPGQIVPQGHQIGQIGSSGTSSGPHLHFHVVDQYANIIDPWAGTCGNATSLWSSQPAYKDTFLLVDHYLVADNPSIPDLLEGPLPITYLPMDANALCYSAQVLSIKPGDTDEIKFVGPGSVPSLVVTHSTYYRLSYQTDCAPVATLRSNPGTWEAQYWFNGNEVSSREFTIASLTGDWAFVYSQGSSTFGECTGGLSQTAGGVLSSTSNMNCKVGGSPTATGGVVTGTVNTLNVTGTVAYAGPMNPFNVTVAGTTTDDGLRQEGTWGFGAVDPANTYKGSRLMTICASPPCSNATFSSTAGNAVIDLTFETVTASGGTAVIADASSSGTLEPQFQRLGDFYHVLTTATYSGDINLCISYADEDDDGTVDGSFVDETTLQLLHNEAGSFVPRTDLGKTDYTNNAICATVSDLSEFALVGPTSVGGIAALPDVADSPAAGHPYSVSTIRLAAIIGAIAAASLFAGTGVWYVRLLRRRL